MKKRIRGSGGGKSGSGSGHTPTEAADSLQSKAYAQILDLVSEGEIEGIQGGLEGVYLNETPIQSATGEFNFKNVKFDFRTGTQEQSYISMFPDTESEVAVNTEITHASPVVRAITNLDIDQIRLKIAFPQLTYQDTDTGDLKGTSVQIAIDLEIDGGGYNQLYLDTINGKSTSKYQREYLVPLSGVGPWNVKVRRVTADSGSVTLQNTTILESYTEVIDSKLRYPNSALVGIRIDAAQFQSIPTRAYHIKGLIVQIPHNYDPVTREYDGEFSGEMVSAYTNNPAWIFYDLITNTRYGLGEYIDSEFVDKWTLYTIGQYCDELVPTGDSDGSYEPRYTMNTYIQSREDAYKVLQDMASNFRSMIFWAGGVLTLSQDSPADAVAIYSPANVVDGLFNYAGSGLKSRHSVAYVTWNDPDDFYRQKVEYVEDPDSIEAFGIVETQVTAYGCTSRGQAHRFGKWLLYTERAQSEIVSFKTGITAAVSRPGDVIKIADPTKAGLRLGGRIVSATTSVLTLDKAVSFGPGTTISVIMPDGSVEAAEVQSTSGSSATLVSPLSATPKLNTMWIAETSEVEAQYFKILAVVESGQSEFEVTAVAHDPDKFAAIEQNLILEPRQISTLSTTPDAPSGLQITETLYAVNAEVRVKVTISWNAVSFATGYVLSWKRDDQNIMEIPQISSNEYEILSAEPGDYEVTVYAVSSIGKRSLSSTATATVLGKATPPGDVEGFSLIPHAGQAYLSWNATVDLDVALGGAVRVRHSPDIVAPEWKDSYDIAPALAGSATRAQVPLLTGTYLIKFVDSSGNASDTASTIATTIPEYYTLNVVETMTESPGFAGTSTDMEVSAFFGGLVLSAAETLDEVMENIDDVPNFDFSGGVVASGSYEFENVIDLGEVYTSRIIASLEVSAIDIADTMDQRANLMDDWTDMDGSLIDDVNAELFVATTLDDPLDVGAEWSEWKRFFVADYSARGLKFKLDVTTESDDHNLIITGLGVTVDMPDRVENFSAVVSGAALYSVVFGKPFKGEPAVGINAHNLNTGDYWVISGKTRSGFDITFKNSAGTNVSRTFDALAKGYGRQLN